MSDLKPELKSERDGANTVPKKASFASTMKTVMWSFLGIRKKSDHEQETAQLNPIHVVIAAVIGVLIFIAVLIMVVKSVVAK